MKFLIGRLAASTLIVLAASGCTTGDPKVTGPVNENKNTLAAEIRKRVADGCKYRTSTDVILNILKKSIPGLEAVSDVAKAVCDAVEASGAPGSPPPKVAGVTITGRFIKSDSH